MKIYSAGIIHQLMTTIRMLALMIMRSTFTTTFVHLHLRHEWSEHLYTPINVYLFVIFYCLLEEVEIDVFMEIFRDSVIYSLIFFQFIEILP